MAANGIPTASAGANGNGPSAPSPNNIINPPSASSHPNQDIYKRRGSVRHKSVPSIEHDGHGSTSGGGTVSGSNPTTGPGSGFAGPSGLVMGRMGAITPEPPILVNGGSPGQGNMTMSPVSATGASPYSGLSFQPAEGDTFRGRLNRGGQGEKNDASSSSAAFASSSVYPAGPALQHPFPHRSDGPSSYPMNGHTHSLSFSTPPLPSHGSHASFHSSQSHRSGRSRSPGSPGSRSHSPSRKARSGGSYVVPFYPRWRLPRALHSYLPAFLRPDSYFVHAHLYSNPPSRNSSFLGLNLLAWADEKDASSNGHDPLVSAPAGRPRRPKRRPWWRHWLRPLTCLLLILLIPSAIFAAIYVRLLGPGAMPYNHIYNTMIDRYGRADWLYVPPSRRLYSGWERPLLMPGLLNARWMGEWNVPILTPPTYVNTSYVPGPAPPPPTQPALQLQLQQQGVKHGIEPVYHNAAANASHIRHEALTSPALLMLHIFSMPRASGRKRRAFIRSLHPLNQVPPPFRHLVEVKFVLGFPDPDQLHLLSPSEQVSIRAEEAEIEKEQKKYGDIMRIEGLVGGENMDDGKTWEWLRAVGSAKAERAAWWVLKCDDDTYPIMPALLTYLLRNSASNPSYVGTHLGAGIGHHYYFEGMMYGFSWGVVKTLATADVPREDVTVHGFEDVRMGEVMFSLPSAASCPSHTIFSWPEEDWQPAPLVYDAEGKPYHNMTRRERLALSWPMGTRDAYKFEPRLFNYPLNPDQCNPFLPIKGTWKLTPRSPDSRTALRRLDLGKYLGAWDQWWVARADGDKGSVGFHGVKSMHEYTKAHKHAKRSYEKQWREYMWRPPLSMKKLAAWDDPKTKYLKRLPLYGQGWWSSKYE